MIFHSYYLFIVHARPYATFSITILTKHLSMKPNSQLPCSHYLLYVHHQSQTELQYTTTAYLGTLVDQYSYHYLLKIQLKICIIVIEIA